MCHKIVGTRVRSRKQVEGQGFDARKTLRILMCEQMRTSLVVFLFLFFKAITKGRTPIGVDLGRL